MPKLNMTPEEKAAWGAKMKAAREAKAAETKPDHPEIEDQEDLRETVLTLQRQLKELLDNQTLAKASEVRSQPGFGTSGSLVGSFEKYVLDSAYYPDPSDRLADEQRLRQFWIKKSDWAAPTPANFELKFSVSTTQYETIDNRRVKEPRFTIELIRILQDEDTGEDTGKRFVATRGIFHEDPEAAIEIAGRNGVVVDPTNERAFLNEMRYLRIRDWLLEAFYPPKSDAVQNKHETVIGNRLVEVYTVSTEVGAATPKIPFGDLSRKL